MYLSNPEDFQKHLFRNEDGFLCAEYQGYTFSSVFQPIKTTDGNVFGYEGLVRIKDETSNIIRPDLFFRDPSLSFIDIINTSLLCASIHLRNFAQSGKSDKKIFINASPLVFQVLSHDAKSIQILLSFLQMFSLHPSQLVYEIMEFDEGNIQEILNGAKVLSEYGITVAMDDFGQCASNASRAKILLPSIIKLDKSLLDNFINRDDLDLVDSIELAKSIGAQVILEGLETKEQLDKLAHLDIDMFQGFYLGKPAPLSPQDPAIKLKSTQP